MIQIGEIKTFEEFEARLEEVAAAEAHNAQIRDGIPAHLIDEEKDIKKPEPFMPDSPEKANWCLGKLAAIEEAEAEAKRVRDEMIARAELWYSREIEKKAADKKWLISCLAWFARRENEADPKKKTISLPWGVLKLRALRWSLKAADAEKALAWLKENKPDLIRVKEEPDIDGIKKLIAAPEMGSGKTGAVIAETGEVIDGMETEIGDCLKFDYEITPMGKGAK